MTTPFDFGQIWEQQFDPVTGRYIKLAPTGKRLVLDLSKFRVTHLRGKTRSGKTSTILIPWVYEFAKARGALFLFDLSPEPANLHHAMRAAKAGGKAFKHLCLEPGADSFYFPTFQAMNGLFPKNAVHLAQLLVTAYSADHGPEGQYFTFQGCMALLNGAKEFANSSQSPTPRALAKHLNEPESRKKFPHAQEMVMPLQIMAEYWQLADGPKEREIRIDESIRAGDVVYFYISNLSAPLVARLVSGLALATILHFARERTNSGAKPQIRIHIDEYQSLVSRQMATILAESLKYGVSGYCLSHQSTSQLRSREVDLRHSIWEASDLKIYFSSFGDDTDWIQTLSKRSRIEKSTSMTHGAMLSSSISHSETLVPFISAEAVQDASAIFGMAIIATSDGGKHEEPVFVQMEHRYEKLDHLALPMRQAESPSPPPAERPAGLRVPLDEPRRQKRHASVRALIESCEAEAKWREAG